MSSVAFRAVVRFPDLRGGPTGRLAFVIAPVNVAF